MRFENATDLPARLFRGVLDRTRIAASCALRVTYDVHGEELVLAREQPFIVSPSPWDSPIGPMSSDELFYRGGVDLFVCGHAYAPKGRAVTEAAVTIRCGAFGYRLQVFGDRVWTRQQRTLVPSAPAPFTRMPLTLAHSFGGRRGWDGIEVAYPDNPDGRGFYLSEDDALGQPLANFEHFEAPVRRWDDRPEPVGTGLTPPQFGPRARKSTVFDDNHQLVELRPSFFNQAFPDLVLPQLRPGELLEIHGVNPHETLRLRLPEAPWAVELEIGAIRHVRVPSCDQIGVLPESKQVFVSYRYAFRYVMRPQERRYCRLVPRAGEE
jgi:hypothetical protein